MMRSDENEWSDRKTKSSCPQCTKWTKPKMCPGPPAGHNTLPSKRIDKCNYFQLNLFTANGEMRGTAVAIPFIYERGFFFSGPKIGGDKNDTTNKRNNDGFRCARISARDDFHFHFFFRCACCSASMLNATEKLSRTRQPHRFLFWFHFLRFFFNFNFHVMPHANAVEKQITTESLWRPPWSWPWRKMENKSMYRGVGKTMHNEPPTAASGARVWVCVCVLTLYIEN